MYPDNGGGGQFGGPRTSTKPTRREPSRRSVDCMSKRPIFLIDPTGLGDEELADMVCQALQVYWRATGEIPQQSSEPE
jgi:hypothetical protein